MLLRQRIQRDPGVSEQRLPVPPGNGPVFRRPLCILAGAGYYLGTNFRELDRFVGPVAVGIMVVIVLLYLWRVATWKPRR